MSFADVSRALAQPVRFRVLSCYLARLSLVVVLLRSVPMLVSWWNGETVLLLEQLGVMGSIAAVCLPLSRMKVEEDLRTNEVMVITALSFLLTALAGVLPFTAEGLSFVDALFEAVSAITTTGLSTVEAVQRHSSGFLFDRAWSQWYGGLGIAVFSIGLMLLDQGTASRRLALNGSSDNKDVLASGRVHTRILIVAYGALTVLCIAVLLLAGTEPFSAVTHALSGVSTGGFSIYDRSLGAFREWYVQVLIVLCGVLGAVSLPFYFRLVNNGVKELFANQELWGLLSLSALVIVLLWLFSYGEGGFDWPANAEQAVVLGLSAQTTTGFSNTDVAKLDDASKLVLIFAMLVGGSTGSTAGGIKILRLLIVLRMLQLLVARTALPAHAVLEPRLGGDYLESAEIEKALLVILLFAGTVAVSWLPFLLAGYAPLDALFEVVSACSTTGLSSGITAAGLETRLKWVLIVDMLLGRVEFLAFMVFLYPRTWMSLRSKA
ncbi:MAG: TrkH family potassium uptake protein [Gammaproteobacteria bacterium]